MPGSFTSRTIRAPASPDTLAPRMRADTTTPDTRLSDDMNGINPATTESLTRLMLGGLPTGRSCHALHSRLRYFDAHRRRAGLPEDVGALVEKLGADEVTVSLVNASPVYERTVVVQGGAYAEHRLDRVTLGESAAGVTEAYGADHSAFSVRLAPGCGAQLKIALKRYANPPTFAFPWDR